MSSTSSSGEQDIQILKHADGIGPSTLENFKEAEFDSAAEVGALPPEKIAEAVSGVGYSTAVSVLVHLDKEGLRDTDQLDQELERLVELLRGLFEFDKADRDFGVYKLMNANRAEIDEYIEDDLIGKIESEVSALDARFGSQSEGDIKTDVIDELGPDAAFEGDSLSSKAVNMIEERKDGLDGFELENARSDIYNHVYQFLSTYYDSGDFITRRKRTHHEEPYSVPYDGSNTNFHWVTKNQHYAKTSDHLTRFKFSLNDYSVAFETVAAELEGSGIGNSEYFVMGQPSNVEVSEDENGHKTVQVPFYRRMIDEDDLKRFDDISAGSHNKQSMMNEQFAVDIQGGASDHDVHLDREDLQNKIDEYTTRNQNDFFIHEDIEEFLTSELEEYVKTEIVSFNPADGLDGMSELAVEKGRIVNEITTDIISFVSQLEEFKRKLFEKKKFVTNSYQLIQLTNVPQERYETILDNEAQLADWESSFGIDGSELTTDDLGEFPHNQMMVNTGYFDVDMQSESEPQNKLIHGDNYQAQEFLREKYENSVKCIYIDPPYNTGNANFAYKDNYQRPTWLSMMYDRLKLSRKLLKDDGVIFASIDYREVDNLRFIMNEIFGEENREATITWRRKKETSNDANGFSPKTEFIVCYSMGGFSPNKMPLDDEYVSDAYRYEDDRGKWRATPITLGSGKQGGGYDYSIETPSGRVIEDKKWTHPKETVEELREKNMIYFGQNGDGIPQKKLYLKENDGRSPDDLWLDVGTNKLGRKSLKSIFGDGFSGLTPKPVELIRHILKISISDGESATVLDFFAGSGTTAQAVQELNRERDERVNYIMVEMLDEAFDITEERVKRTAYTDQWKDGQPEVSTENEEPDFDADVECIELESYEDALDAVAFDDTQQTLGAFNTTMLRYLLEFGTKGSPVFLDADQLKTPLEYELNGDVHSQEVDVMTTFNYLIGLEDIKRTREDGYTIYEGQVNESHTQVIWRHDADSVDHTFEAEMFDTSAYDRVYINGDSTLENARPIAPVFEKKMLGETNTL